MALFKKNDNNFQWADDFVEGFLKPMDRHTSLFCQQIVLFLVALRINLNKSYSVLEFPPLRRYDYASFFSRTHTHVPCFHGPRLTLTGG
jgi:hypothetical protein